MEVANANRMDGGAGNPAALGSCTWPATRPCTLGSVLKDSPVWEALGALPRVGETHVQIPAYGYRMFAGAIEQLRRETARQVIVLDLCCSSGTDGALLNHDLGLDALSGNVRGPLGSTEYGP